VTLPQRRQINGINVQTEKKVFPEIPSLDFIDIFDFLDLKEYLSTLIPMEADLVMRDSLKPGIGKNILKEVVYA
jgi:hypothetical protein